MKVEQVIIRTASSRGRSTHQLLGKSPSIRDHDVREICRWSPGKNDLEYGQSESINFFAVDEDSLAIVRNFAGELECQQAGGRKIISHAIVLHRAQLVGYKNCIVSLYRVLDSMGAQTLQLSIEEKLPTLDVPNSPFCLPNGFQEKKANGLTEKLARALDIHHQLVIIGHENPLAFLEAFLAELPVENRADISFATAMNLDSERPFSIQFFREVDSIIEKEIAAMQLRTFSMESMPTLV